MTAGKVAALGKIKINRSEWWSSFSFIHGIFPPSARNFLRQASGLGLLVLPVKANAVPGQLPVQYRM